MKLNMDFNMNNNTGNLGFGSSNPVDEEEQKDLKIGRKKLNKEEKK